MYEDHGTFTYKGYTFRVETTRDNDYGHPWDAEDGHGVVVKAGRRGYHSQHRPPGSRELGYDWYYLQRQSLAKAKRDDWGLLPHQLQALRDKLGREPTAREVIAESVECDYNHLRAYMRDEWCYNVLRVTLLDIDGGATDLCEHLGGVALEYGDDVIKCMRSDVEDMAESVLTSNDINGDEYTSECRARTITYVLREGEAPST